MKNEGMLEVLLVIIIIPLVSLLIGYFISQNVVEPNISKEEAKPQYITIKGIDGFEVVESVHGKYEEAKYRQDLLRLNGIFSFIEGDGEKYKVVIGLFLTKEEALEFAGLMSSKGITPEVYAKKSPYLKIKYDKNLTSEIEYFTNKLDEFQQILGYISVLSFKSFNGSIETQEVQELKRKVEVMNKDKKAFKEKEVEEISGEVDKIVQKIADSVKLIEISSSLKDKNTFSLLQQLLWNSWGDYNNFLENIAK